MRASSAAHIHTAAEHATHLKRRRRLHGGLLQPGKRHLRQHSERCALRQRPLLRRRRNLRAILDCRSDGNPGPGQGCDESTDQCVRDVVILRLVAKHRLVNAQQLYAALGRAGHPRAFAHRLATLFHGGVLDRPRAQFRPGQPARPYVYAIGPRGREELNRLDGIAPRGKRDIRAENERLKLHFLDHETATAEVALAFQLATERQGWSFELALDDEISAATGVPPVVDIAFMSDVPDPLPLRPDAHVVIDAGDGARRSYFLEVDLGTEPHIRWNLRTSSILRKAIAYWQLSFWKPSPVDGVIFLTTSLERAGRMIDVVRRVDPKSRGSHFFQVALLKQCRMDTHESLFYEPLFRSSKIGYENPRPLFLPECPTCHESVDIGNESYCVLNSVPPELVFDAGTTPLAEHLPEDAAPEYAHRDCPWLVPSPRF